MSPNIKDDRVLALKYRPEKFEDLIGQNTNLILQDIKFLL